MSNQYQRFTYEPAPPRKRAPFPWKDVVFLVLVLMAWRSAYMSDWSGLAVVAVGMAGIVWVAWRQDQEGSDNGTH